MQMIRAYGRTALLRKRQCTANRALELRRPLATLTDFPGPVDKLYGPRESRSQSALDDYILTAFLNIHAEGQFVPLSTLLRAYQHHSYIILEDYLPYEPSPTLEKKVKFTPEEDRVVMVAHIVIPPGEDPIVFVCSGFPIRSRMDITGDDRDGTTFIVTCTHTLEQVLDVGKRRFPFLLQEGKPARQRTGTLSSSILLTHAGDVIPVVGVASALPRRDLALLEIPGEWQTKLLPFPVSPYPSPEGTPLRTHNTTESAPPKRHDEWNNWIGGQAKRTWAKGNVLGYRDMAWREAQPGTYDDLSHLLFSPPPTSGSSGGPIVEEESGAVVGSIVGERVDNHVVGQRGWGVPAEALFEMFSLPGLVMPKKKKGKSNP